MTRRISGLFLLLWAAVFCTSIFSTDVCAQESSPALTLYNEGKFEQALEALQKAGLKTSADYYNAGNCYFRIGKLGQALSYYEKAQALDPSHADIRYNLKLTKEALEKNGALPKNKSFWSGYIIPFARRVSEPWINFPLALLATLLAWFVYREHKKGVKASQILLQPATIAIMTVWVLLAAMDLTLMSARDVKLAAVVSDVSVARSGPNDSFTELFKLPAGTKVELSDQTRDGWRQVRFSLGNVGWVMEKDLLEL